MYLTNEQSEFLIAEVAERLKDIAYSKCEDTVRNSLAELGFGKAIPDNEPEDSSLTFYFDIEMLVADLRQILARYDRTKQQLHIL